MLYSETSDVVHVTKKELELPMNAYYFYPVEIPKKNEIHKYSLCALPFRFRPETASTDL